jgi:UDP-N-acetylglucosamine--N-acetylmuramyl-(pentapeptide) pyrophosphoryl-undecaprenol N-acetylglucosamine transferase
VVSAFVASSGGHLIELLELSGRIPECTDESLWVTYDSAEARSLLAHRNSVLVRRATSRDFSAMPAHALSALDLFRRYSISQVFSTGAGVAVPFFGVGRARNVECNYIESATRTEGPSLTGRVIQRIPGVKLFTQHTLWAESPWKYAGSVFDGFERVQAEPHALGKVTVTVGSSTTFGFRRMIQALSKVIPEGIEVLWQSGCTDVAGLGIRGISSLSPSDLAESLAAADVVVAHAGVGTALTALSAGRLPVLIPRLRNYGEHVDDHQQQVASDLAQRGLAIVRDADELCYADLVEAASFTVARRPVTSSLDFSDTRS